MIIMSNNNNMNHSYKSSGDFIFFLQMIKHYRKSLPGGTVYYQDKYMELIETKFF